MGLVHFQASRGWLLNFMRRFQLTIRRRTTTGQTLPKDAHNKIFSFIKFYEKQRNVFNFPLNCIANMDETPI